MTAFTSSQRWTALAAVASLGAGCGAKTVYSKTPPPPWVLSCLEAGQGPVAIERTNTGDYSWRCGQAPCTEGDQVAWSVAGGAATGPAIATCSAKVERRDAPPEASASLTGNAVRIVALRRVECRTQTSDWKTCGTKPLADDPVTLSAGDITLNGRTAADGTARFDLSDGITSASSDPATASITVSLADGNAYTSVNTSASPAYSSWRNAFEAKQRAVRSERANASIAASLAQVEPRVQVAERLLADLERARAPWGEKEIATATRLSAVGAEISPLLRSYATALTQSDDPDPDLLLRFAKLKPWMDRLPMRIDALTPRLSQALGRRQQQQTDNLVNLMTILAAMPSSNSGGGSSPSGASSADDRLRAAEQTHHQERAEDERRRQGERADDARKEQQQRDDEKHASFVRCEDACDVERSNCETRCSNRRDQPDLPECHSGGCFPIRDACRQRCHEQYGR